MSTPGYLNPPMPNRGDVLNRRPYDSTRAPMACPQRSIYRFLGVAEDAPFAEVKKAYHKAALRLHPDKNPDNIKAATKQFQALQSAFRVLKEREERGLPRKKGGCGKPGCTKCFRRKAQRAEGGQEAPRKEKKSSKKGGCGRPGCTKCFGKEGGQSEAPPREKKKQKKEPKKRPKGSAETEFEREKRRADRKYWRHRRRKEREEEEERRWLEEEEERMEQEREYRQMLYEQERERREQERILQQEELKRFVEHRNRLLREQEEEEKKRRARERAEDRKEAKRRREEEKWEQYLELRASWLGERPGENMAEVRAQFLAAQETVRRDAERIKQREERMYKETGWRLEQFVRPILPRVKRAREGEEQSAPEAKSAKTMH